MVTHYIYEEPDPTTLNQGDVLIRHDDLVAILSQYHQHYAQHPDYKYFMVVTQSCDLVRRGGAPPKSPYVSICAVRPVEDALLREAAKYQEAWQRETSSIGGKAKSNLMMFLQRLLDNNEDGHFYLHPDRSVGIEIPSCAFLPLSVALRAEHYQTLLRAKIAQLRDTFQAKLGWLIGNMYSRVGTTEWDTNYPENPVRAEAEAILGRTLRTVGDDQIKEGLAELREGGRLAAMRPAEILEHIRSKQMKPRSRKVLDRALEVVSENRKLKPINTIQGRAYNAIWNDGAVRQSIETELRTAGIEDTAPLAETLIRIFNVRFKQVLSDENLPSRDELLQGFVRGIFNDAKIAKFLS